MTPRHRIAVYIVASCAAIGFLWAIESLWFGYPKLSPDRARLNAIIMIVLWALGPPVWFFVEWSLWKGPGLQEGQQYARDFWLGAGAIVLLLAARELGVG
jgi:hypothetical protein